MRRHGAGGRAQNRHRSNAETVTCFQRPAGNQETSTFAQHSLLVSRGSGNVRTRENSTLGGNISAVFGGHRPRNMAELDQMAGRNFDDCGVVPHHCRRCHAQTQETDPAMSQRPTGPFPSWCSFRKPYGSCFLLSGKQFVMWDSNC